MQKKGWVWPWARGFPSIYTQWLKLATSKMVHSLGLPWPIVKSHTEEKVDVMLYYRSSSKFWDFALIFVQRLKLATSNLACTWGLPRPTIKPHPEEKVGVALG